MADSPGLTEELQQVLSQAYATANQHKTSYVTLEYLLLAMCSNKDARAAFHFCNADLEELRAQVSEFVAQHKIKQRRSGEQATPTIALERVLQRAASLTASLLEEEGQVSAEIQGSLVLRAMLEEEDSNAVYFMHNQGMDKHEMNSYIRHIYNNHTPRQSSQTLTRQQDTNLGLPANVPTSYAINLNELVMREHFDPLIGRTEEMLRIIQVLSRQRKHNPLLLGETGVGKTALVYGLAMALEEGEVPPHLSGCEIFALDTAGLLAGAKYRGDFEKRVKTLTAHLESKHAAILFIDDIHSVFGGTSAAMENADIASLLKPIISRGKLRCIGATNYEYYRSLRKRDLVNYFQPVEIKEMSQSETTRVLEAVTPRLEKFHRVRYSADALQAALSLSTRYLARSHQPDKALDVLDEAGAQQRIMAAGDFVVGDGFGAGGTGYKDSAEVGSKFLRRLNFNLVPSKPGEAPKQQGLRVGKEEIQNTIARMTGLPLANLQEDTAHLIKHLEQELSRNIFGQDEALRQLVAAFKLARAGLNQPERPLGCYMFAGPTGVGKTAACVQLSKSAGLKLIRYDMSEYSESHTVARLIGAPPGYVGFDNGSQLTTAVMKAPHSVVLFDEMEKAHPSIYNLLLQIMDYGQLTDNTGQKCDFRNTIIIMTTNAGSAERQKRTSGFASGELRDGSQSLAETFSPEFRNRLDATIQFGALDLSIMEQIVLKLVEDLAEQLAERNITLEVSAAARTWLAKHGYDPLMGARPLARLFTAKVKAPLADLLLFQNLGSGKQLVKVLVQANQLSLNYAAA